MKNVMLKYTIMIAVFCQFILTSCEKWVEVESPGNLIASADVFSSQKGYEAAMAGLYMQMRSHQSISGGGLSSYVSLGSDDLMTTSTTVANESFYQNTVLSSNSIVSNFWMNAYKAIYRTNLILEKLEQDEVLTVAVRDNFKGQALFVRSFYYFYLMQLFGDVPLSTETDYTKNSKIGRTPSNQILQQVTADLKLATALIGNQLSKERDVPELNAAYTLLARVYLYQKDYDQVITTCEMILNDPNFKLESNVNNTFLKTSKETIWQLSSTTAAVSEGTLFIPSSANIKPVFTISTSLLDQFESTDLRLKNWISTQVIAGIAYPYPAKYKNYNSLPPNEYAVVFRLSEDYLMKAEALIAMNVYQQAQDDINQIRKRAGLMDIQSLDPIVLREALIKEWRSEYFAEWGHRWLDLKRWGLIDQVLTDLKPNWETTAQWLPIPLSEIQTNIFLIQNPGYDD